MTKLEEYRSYTTADELEATGLGDDVGFLPASCWGEGISLLVLYQITSLKGGGFLKIHQTDPLANLVRNHARAIDKLRVTVDSHKNNRSTLIPIYHNQLLTGRGPCPGTPIYLLPAPPHIFCETA